MFYCSFYSFNGLTFQHVLLVRHCVTLHFKKCLYYMNLNNFSGVSVKSNLASMIRQGVAG